MHEKRWTVRTHDLPRTEIVEVEWERDTCSLGLYETREDALRAAEEHVLTYWGQSCGARDIVVKELDKRVEAAERELRAVRQRIHDELLNPTR